MNHLNQTKIRCAVYARPDRKGAYTVGIQSENCHAEAALRGWTIAQEYIFTDDRLNAMLALGVRPGFAELMREARREPRPFTHLLVDGTQALSRVTSDVLKAFSELSRNGVTLVALKRRT
jgi:DNA invertase Pin-like site-specific DNA recombinase